jgi:hypothetical protein
MDIMADLERILGQVLSSVGGSMTGGINPLAAPDIAASVPDAIGQVKSGFQPGMPIDQKILSAVPAALELGTGGDIGDHMDRAKADPQFSKLNPTSAHHASAAEGATERLGFGKAMGGGVLMELLEDALGTENSGLSGDTFNDLKANLVGGARGAGFPGISEGIQNLVPDVNPEAKLQDILKQLLGRGVGHTGAQTGIRG